MSQEGITLYVAGETIEVPVTCTVKELCHEVENTLLNADLAQRYRLTFAGTLLSKKNESTLSDMGICPESTLEFEITGTDYFHARSEETSIKNKFDDGQAIVEVYSNSWNQFMEICGMLGFPDGTEIETLALDHLCLGSYEKILLKHGNVVLVKGEEDCDGEICVEEIDTLCFNSEGEMLSETGWVAHILHGEDLKEEDGPTLEELRIQHGFDSFSELFDMLEREEEEKPAWWDTQ